MGIIVTGMHRSGTAVTARALAAISCDAELPADDFPASTDNPSGYAESRHLTQFNDLLLWRLGGDHMSPPPRPAGWADRVKSYRGTTAADSAELFESTFASSNWIWKDPRLCLVMEYWQDLLPCFDGMVISFRNPLEVALSLSKRPPLVTRPRRMSPFEIWHAYVASSVEAAWSIGCPVFFSSYCRLISEGNAWLDQAVSFLEMIGVTTYEQYGQKIAPIVRPELYRNRTSVEETCTMPESNGMSQAVAVFHYLTEVEGVHRRLPRTGYGDETRLRDSFCHGRD